MKKKTILLLNPGPRGSVQLPKGSTMKKTRKSKKKTGKMPAALAKYWAERRNPSRKKAKGKKRVRRNPGPASRSGRALGTVRKYVTKDLLMDAGLGVVGYAGARMIANAAAKVVKPEIGKPEPILLRAVGVVQFAAGAFLAVKLPKLRGLGVGMCVAGVQDAIRRNVPALAPMLGADDETLLAYVPAPSLDDLPNYGAPLSLGEDSLTNYQSLGAPVSLGAPLNLGGFDYNDASAYGYSAV